MLDDPPGGTSAIAAGSGVVVEVVPIFAEVN
jgi:hypothetical protein